MSVKVVAALGVALLLAGLLIGYVWWGRPLARSDRAATPDLAKELDDVKARLAEQTQRADEAQKRLAELEAEFQRAMEGLKQERERLEEALSKGQK